MDSSENVVTDLKRNIERIRHEISQRQATEKSICIVAVTKHQPLSLVQTAVECGIKDLAVNYAQEGETLHQGITSADIAWGLGSRDMNKAKVKTVLRERIRPAASLFIVT